LYSPKSDVQLNGENEENEREFSVTKERDLGSPRIKIIVLKIIQNLIKIAIPFEVFNCRRQSRWMVASTPSFYRNNYN
jgi:hypothetical protein